MENLDLEIDNYSLEDILSLFQLNSDFTEEDLKSAKKMVLMTHPDKSQLNQEVFLFFTAAYKYLYFIFQFRHRNNKSIREDLDGDEAHAEIIAKIRGKKDFNKLFNQLFEENKMRDEFSEKGYDEWYRCDNEEDQDESANRKINNQTDMRQAFYEEKKRKMQLIEYKGVEEMEDNSHFELSRDAPENYGSSLFSKLQYEDLKKAHTENIIPVSEQDYDPAQHFRSVTQLQSFRETQDTNPMDDSQAKRYLENKEKLESRENTRRAFLLAKQMEEGERKNERILAKFKYLQ
jgi:hypothetical protein